MPRNARIDIAGCLYHVIARGNERHSIFRDDVDYLDFLSRLRTSLDKTGNKCLAWCLMPNHFHLLILRGERPLSELMRRLMTGYVGSFNQRHKRCGHLFQNRYKAILCEEEEYLLELAAYIHLNPLRAGLVRGYQNLEKYRWTGHGEITGARRAEIAERDYVLEHFAGKTVEAVHKYDRFLRERINKFKTGELSGGGLLRSLGSMENVQMMRRSGDKKICDARVLGSGQFVAALLKQSEKPHKIKSNAEDVLKQVCARTGVTAEEIKSRSRERSIVAARAEYCYLAKEAGIRGEVLSEELGRNSGAISYLATKGRLSAN
ncbi:MAG: transposase [Elusimicrobia bacterium]|nr:transposase [Elusimicrobiota bacterium]